MSSFMSQIFDFEPDNTKTNIGVESIGNYTNPTVGKEKQQIKQEPEDIILPISSLTVLDMNPECLCLKLRENYYKVYVKSSIHSTTPYRFFVNLLRNAAENDIIQINISTPGGNVNTGMLLFDAMENSKALIVTNIENYGYSLGALMWSYGDILMLNVGCLMYHNIIMTGSNNVNKLQDASTVQNEFSMKLFTEIKDKGLLTEEDMNYIFKKNKDLYLSKDIMEPRIIKYNQTHNSRYQELMSQIVGE